jgi:drug/metabolite transporter (DMT)-like permease
MKDDDQGHFVYLVLGFVQILFGINFVASKVIVTEISPFIFASTRFLLSALLLGAFLYKKAGGLTLEKKHWPMMMILAFVGFSLSQSLFLFGLQRTTAINTSVLSTTIPLFTILINVVRKKESLNTYGYFGIAIALVGVLVLKKVESMSISNATLTGDLLVLSSFFSMAIFLSYSHDFFSRVSPIKGSVNLFFFGGLFLIPFALFFDQIQFPSLNKGLGFWGWFAYSIIGATLLTYFLNNWALTKVSSNYVGLFIFLQPVVTSLIAWGYLSEEISTRTIVSIVVILVGMGMVTFLKKRQKRYAHG